MTLVNLSFSTPIDLSNTAVDIKYRSLGKVVEEYFSPRIFNNNQYVLKRSQFNDVIVKCVPSNQDCSLKNVGFFALKVVIALTVITPLVLLILKIVFRKLNHFQNDLSIYSADKFTIIENIITNIQKNSDKPNFSIQVDSNTPYIVTTLSDTEGRTWELWDKAMCSTGIQLIAVQKDVHGIDFIDLDKNSFDTIINALKQPTQ